MLFKDFVIVSIIMLIQPILHKFLRLRLRPKKRRDTNKGLVGEYNHPDIEALELPIPTDFDLILVHNVMRISVSSCHFAMGKIK